jgi:hypothetical protein
MFGIVDDRDALCPGCKTLPTVDQMFNHHHMIHDCSREFLSCECPFCVWLSEARVDWSDSKLEDVARQVSVEIVGSSDGQMKDLYLMFMFEGTQDCFGSTRLEMIAKPCRSLKEWKCGFRSDPILIADHFSATILRRDPFLDPSSPDALQMIDTWLKECISEHKHCGPRANFPLPTYLVDVGDEDVLKVNLVRTNSDMKYPFVALSYVWGIPQQPIELRKHTVDDMLIEIAAKDLPQTILDATMMTRRLKIRYLWVDSLCIVQDDRMMKSEEIAKMGGIFAGSVLTIQAASAETVHIGFLHLRARKDVPEQKLRYSGSSDECVTIRPKHPTVGTHAPTNARAWCYEESVLPTRLLTFGRDELSFKCKTTDQFESGKRLQVRDRFGPGLFGSLSLENGHSKPPYNGDRRLLILKTWYESIDFMYSPRLLTKAHDRLPAIEGVARKIQPWASGRYFAGLWESDLVFGLLWRISDRILSHMDFTVANLMRDRKKSGYKSVLIDQPSWSWASVDGPVLHTARRRVLETVAQVSIPILRLGEHDDPFGAIDGRLCMSAPIRAAILEPRFHKDGTPHYRGAITQEIICSDTGLIKSEMIGEAYSDSWHTIPKDVWCAAVIRRYGLLLESIDDSRKRYRRVGLFIMSESYWEIEPKFAQQGKVELEII